jgi:hypothetical protein
MTATNHALTGAAIAAAVKQPFLAVPLALASHFVCDFLPHFDIPMKFGSKRMYTWVILDSLTAIGFAIFLLVMGVSNPVILTLAAIAAMSPDLAWLYYGLRGLQGQLNKYDPLTRFHHKIQRRLALPGLIIEIVWAGAMVSFILSRQ